VPSTWPIRVGLGADVATFPKFKHYVGDQLGIQRYSSNKRVNGVTGFVELQRQDWAYGVGIRTGKNQFAQTFAPGLGLPDQTTGSATGYFVNPYIGRQWRIKDLIRFQANTGPVVGLNRLLFRWLWGTEPQEDTRTHWGVQWNVGVAVTLEHSNGWGGRFGADHVGFIESADNNNRLFAAAYWRIFGGHRMAGERRETLPRGRGGS
jgi:hypothetical protein